ncbi:MAG: hypothetical protein IJS90_02330 [Clostridia bacterium]|nr:hypothetical protein [Clostridia bacterium]
MAFNSVKAYVLDCITKLFGELQTRLSPAALSGRTSDLINDSEFVSTAMVEAARIGPLSNLLTNQSGLIGGVNVNVDSFDPGSELASLLIAASQSGDNLYLNDDTAPLTKFITEDDGEYTRGFIYNLTETQTGAALGFDRADSAKQVYLILLSDDEEEDSGYSLTCISDASLANETWSIKASSVDLTPTSGSDKLIKSKGVYTAIQKSIGLVTPQSYDAVISADDLLLENASFTVESGNRSQILDKLQHGYSVRVRVYASVANVDHLCKEFFSSKVQAGNNNSVLIGLYDLEEGKYVLLAWTANGVAVD